MCLILKEFIDLNYKKLKPSDVLSKSITQHREASDLLMTHYDIRHELGHPTVEYSRYVLTKGSDEEKIGLINGIENNLILKDETIRLEATA